MTSTQGVPKVKGSALWEYSVVYTDRAQNLMATNFQTCMRDISAMLKRCYNADSTALIPGSGSYGMESIAWQFGHGKKCMVIRNGYFSYRWSNIFHVTKLPSDEMVLKASAVDNRKMPAFAPMPIEKVVATIHRDKPFVVFAPHVETATGMLLPDSYIRSMADAVHSYGGFLVIDAIAAGSVWCDMKKTGADVVLSAPQKAWSGPACCAFVMLSARAAAYVRYCPDNTNSGVSFCCNLKEWLDVMDKYENKGGSGPGFKYYTTLPTDALMQVREAMMETETFGFAKAKSEAFVLGKRIRGVFESRGFHSVAAEGFQSPGVVVSYSPYSNMGGRFKAAGLQIAGGVPFKLDEDTKLNLNTRKCTFRIGLFGIDKWKNIDEVVSRLEIALDSMDLSSIASKM